MYRCTCVVVVMVAVKVFGWWASGTSGNLMLERMAMQIAGHVPGGTHTVLEAWLHGGSDSKHHKALKELSVHNLRQIQREVHFSRCLAPTSTKCCCHVVGACHPRSCTMM